MKRTSTGWRHYWLAIGLLCLVTLALSLSVRVLFRRTARITLPDSFGLTWNGGAGVDGFSVATPLEVTPDTAQAVIATLARPTSYRREITVRRTWSGGERDAVLTVTVAAPWTRVDRVLPDGEVRHSTTDGNVTYIWYGDDDANALRLPAGSFTADDEQLIPTYEDVLRLPRERIALADYHRVESGMDCVYIETTQEDSVKERYWIGVTSGLLVAAERLVDGNSVYWMEATELEEAFPEPDGT